MVSEFLFRQSYIQNSIVMYGIHHTIIAFHSIIDVQ